MNVKVEDVEKNVVKLVIEVDAETLEEGLNNSYKKNARRFNVPGFRKGRAPRSMVERFYGVEVLYEDAIDGICPGCYEKAIAENNLEPVDSPEFDLVELERGKPFIFSATVTVKPEVILGQYKGVEATYKSVVVTDDDIDDVLKTTANKNARLLPCDDRPAQEGDMLLIDYDGSIDGEPFEGGKKEGHNLEIGSHSFIDGFEEQLIGANVGDTVKVNVRFPNDYNSEEVRGKDAVFDVTVNAIKVMELPEIDDEFAQDVSSFDTLEEYRADIRKELTEDQEEKAKQDFEDELIKRIVEDAQIDVPEPMITRQIERDIKEFEMSLIYQGLDLEHYFQYASTSREELEDSLRERAVEEIRARLVFEKVAKEEAIEVTDDDYEAELRKRAEKYKKDYEEYKSQVSEDLEAYIKYKLKADKTMAFLSDNASRV